MYELEKTEEVKQLSAVTRSNSGISGPQLAKAHMKLGMLLAQHMDLPPDDTTVVAVLRGGIFFAEGIYFELGCRFQTYDPKHQEFIRPPTTNVVLVDSVINTGKTLHGLVDSGTVVACNVINQEAVKLFDKKLFAVRISSNSFVGTDIKQQSGSAGPDTTLRLFNQL